VPTHFLRVHVFAVRYVMSISFSKPRALPSPCYLLLVVILACPLHSDTHSLFSVPSGVSQERADARLREQILLLEQATKQEKDKETLVDSLRREAEQRKFQVCFTNSMHVLCVCVCVCMRIDSDAAGTSRTHIVSSIQMMITRYAYMCMGVNIYIYIYV